MAGTIMGDNTIYLTSSEPEIDVSTFTLQIERCGYRVERFQSNLSTNRPVTQLATGVIGCVFGGQSLNVQQKQCLYSWCQTMPVLAIVCPASTKIDKTIYTLCSEFVYWPCSEHELAMRIARSLSAKSCTYLPAKDECMNIQLSGYHNFERRTAILDRRIAPNLHSNYQATKAKIIADFERKYLCWLMVETKGNVTRAAEKVGKERRALGKLLKKHNIDKHHYQQLKTTT